MTSTPASQLWTDKVPVGEDLVAEYDKFMPNWNKGRRAGVLLHPTSLPGPYGTGELGEQCFAFIDWLQKAGMQCWQVLPLVPPDGDYFSPYSGQDANSGNPFLISLDLLVKQGLLDESDLPPTVPVAWADFPTVAKQRIPLLTKAAQRLLSEPGFAAVRQEMQEFKARNPWVEDSALFDALRKQPGLDLCAWWDWPEEIRLRDPVALEKARSQHAELINEYIAVQYLFDKQWADVRAYANSKGVKIIGDMPIYVGGHSADVWANRNLFELNAEGKPEAVSGVPPDAFSETGQLWGSPLYRWPAHKAQKYRWWGDRLGRALALYDETRIDHFRGFSGYWSVEATAETAMGGKWVKGPGRELFDALKKQIGAVPILAEDLGVITQDVVELRESIGAPGMVVLQFAWGGGNNNVHLPHMHYENCFCYPGTHDNETSVGWYQGSATPVDKKYLQAYLDTDGEDIAWDFIRAAMQSVARTSIFMMQDVMRLDNTARMNRPGLAAGNWGWRVGEQGVWESLEKEADDLKRLAYVYNRLPPGEKYTF